MILYPGLTLQEGLNYSYLDNDLLLTHETKIHPIMTIIMSTALMIAKWNAKESHLRKTRNSNHFLKHKAINMCCIQETHLSSSHRFFIWGYEVFRQDRENRPKGGLLTLVRNNIPASEIQRSGQADLDMEYLGVKLILTGTPLSVFNTYSPPDKQIQLLYIKVEPQSWIITGDFNSHSAS